MNKYYKKIWAKIRSNPLTSFRYKLSMEVPNEKQVHQV